MKRMSEVFAVQDRTFVNHAEVPELGWTVPQGVIEVPTGRHRIGTKADRFVSRGFAPCTGYALQDPFKVTFGFLHAYTGIELEQEDFEKLEPLRGGQAIAIEGSASLPKRRLLRDLKESLQIELVRTIHVDTFNTGDETLPFHVVFRPDPNQILVARISRRDVLTFKGF